MNTIMARRAHRFVAFFVLSLSVCCFTAFGQGQPPSGTSGALAADESADTSSGPPIRVFRGRTMGTTYMVKVAGADTIDDQTLRLKIDLELRRVNDQMSTYLKSSEISRFNRSESTDWFQVSPDFARVVAAAQQISRKTDGAFDVTVGPLIDAWNFGAGERTGAVPDAETITDLKQRVGYQQLAVRLDPPALKKSRGDLAIDLSAIAKGHGVDRVVALLAELGVANTFVEIGGEVRVAGSKPDGPWRVGIQLPDAGSGAIMAAQNMAADDPAGTAMATSGDYRNFFQTDGKRYSHTIDPRSGRPVDHSLASVTVVADTCMMADGWATALSVLGPDEGLGLADELGLHTLLVSRQAASDVPDGDGTPRFNIQGTGVLAQHASDVAAGGGAPNGQTPQWLLAVLPVAVLSFIAFSILLAAMAIGVMFGRRSIGGSCGGLANQTNADGSTSCSLCSSPSDACRELREKMEAADGDSQRSRHHAAEQTSDVG